MPGKNAWEISTDIKISVIGDEEVRRAAKALIEFNTAIKESARFKQIAINQTRDEIASLKESNGIMKAKSEMSASYVKALAVQRNKEEDYTFAFENRMAMEQDALRFQQLYKSEGMSISIKEARVVAQANAEIVVSEEAKRIAFAQSRRELMQVSISLFVMSITANQLLASLLPLVKGNKELTQALKNMKAMFNMAVAPMQMFTALMGIMINTQMQLTTAVTLFGSAMGAAFFWMMAFTSESATMRAVFGAIAGVMTALAIATFLSATANMAWAASLATIRAMLLDPTGFIALAAGIAGIGAGVAAVAGAKSAQTRPGQMKRITKSGIAEVHAGEIWRPEKGGRSDVGSGGSDTIIYLPAGYSGTASQSRFFAKEIYRLKNTGQGTIKFRRAVVS